MANNKESEYALRRLVPLPPRAMVPILYTDIFLDVPYPPSIFRDILKPSAPPLGLAPPLDGPPPAPDAAPGGIAPSSALPFGPTPTPAPPIPDPGSAPPASGPAPGPAPPAAVSPNDQSASAVASRHPLMHAPAPAVAHFNTNRSPSPALSALTEVSYGSMTSIESEEPTVPPTPQQRRRWDINGTTPINPPAKAPTKANVRQLLSDLYGLRTTQEIDDKYIEFRTAIDGIAKRKLTQNTFTKQNASNVQQLYDDLSKAYPWFSRCVDGWPARPYLLERQRNAVKRQMVKQEVEVGREAKKVLGGLRRDRSNKKATPLLMRKTRSSGSK